MYSVVCVKHTQPLARVALTYNQQQDLIMFDIYDDLVAFIRQLFRILATNTRSLEKASDYGELQMDHLIANSKLANQMEQLQTQKALEKENKPKKTKKTKK